MRVLAILDDNTPTIPVALQRTGHDVRLAVSNLGVVRNYAQIPQIGKRASFGGTTTVDSAVEAWSGAPPELVMLLSLAAPARPLALRARELFPTVPFIGSTDPAFVALEEDRGAFKDACRAAGVRVPDAQVWPLADLRARLGELRWPAMLKPFSYREGHGLDRKYLVVKARDAGEAAIALDVLEKSGPGTGQRVLVEQFVEGFEISCGAFFDGQAFRGPWLHMVEYKSFAAGDVGPNIDEPAVHCAVVPDEGRDFLAAEVRKLVPLLRSSGYRGLFDLNFIVDADRTAWAIEPDCRFPMPATLAVMAEADLAELLVALCAGRPLPWSPSRHALVAGALHIGFPFCANLPEGFHRKPLIGLQRSRRAFPVALGAFDTKAGEWLVETSNGYLFGCVGAGATIAEAQRDLRAVFDSVKYPYMYYRADVGSRPPPAWLDWG